jgi:RNase adaptor protein for sRNA GlmZ degradation
LNPGRFDEYKKLTGRDKSVQDFLEQRTKMAEFLNSILPLLTFQLKIILKEVSTIYR